MDEKNTKKFIRFYEKNLNKIYRFCYIRTNNKEVSKDLAQQAFLKTWVYVKSGEKDIKFRALVYKIAGNLVIDWYRKKKEESLDLLVEEGLNIISEEKIEEEVSLDSTLRILNKLSDDDKTLITLRFVDNLKPKEISNILKKDVNLVSVGIHRAKERLKKIIKKEGYELF